VKVFEVAAERYRRCPNRTERVIDSGNWVLWAGLSALFAALTAIFAKLGLSEVDPDLATLIRTAVILAILFPFVLLTGKWTNPLHLPARSAAFLVLSAIATGVSWVCYFRALQVGDASKVAPVDKLSVVLVAVFAYVALGERPALKDWLGIAFISLGVVLLAIRR